MVLSRNELIYEVLSKFKEDVLNFNGKKEYLFRKFCAEYSETAFFSTKIPCLMNFFSFMLPNFQQDVNSSKEFVVRMCNLAQKRLVQDNEKVIDNISGVIKKNNFVLVHNYVGALVESIKRLKLKGLAVNFSVTDSPFSEVGKKYVSQLRYSGVAPFFYPMAAARSAIKKADVVFVGAEAVTSKKVVCDVGSELLAELASKYMVPFYVVSSSWDFYEKVDVVGLEMLKTHKTKGTHSFFKQGFELVEPSLVSGVISERGITSHSYFVDGVRRDRKTN